MRSTERGDHCVYKRRFSSSGPTPAAIVVQSRPDRKRDMLHLRELYLCMEKERCARTRIHVHACL